MWHRVTHQNGVLIKCVNYIWTVKSHARDNNCVCWHQTFCIYYILNTNLMHWLLFIHKILSSSTCFEHQVLIFRRIQLCTSSIWYCHSLWEFLLVCRYTDWVRTDCRGKVVGGCLKTPTKNLPPYSQFSLKLCTDRPPRTLTESDSTICCMCKTISSWRLALDARNMYRRIVFYE